MKPALVFALSTSLLVQDGADKRTATGRTVTYRSGETIVVNAPVSDASKHVAVVLRLPELITKALVPWDEADISIETDGAVVMLKLLRTVEGDLAFRGRSGTLYRFHVRTADAANADSELTVVDPAPALAPIPKTQKIGALELIRAMRLGQALPESTLNGLGDTLVHETEAIVLRAKVLYATGRHRGYVLELANKSRDRAHRVELSAFAAKNLLLAGAKDLVVPPGGTTRIYLVFSE